MHKVLIIDDEKQILDSLSSILRDEGFQVHTAIDGREGLRLFDSIKPAIVLLDVWMPELDGLAATPGPDGGFWPPRGGGWRSPWRRASVAAGPSCGPAAG